MTIFRLGEAGAPETAPDAPRDWMSEREEQRGQPDETPGQPRQETKTDEMTS